MHPNTAIGYNNLGVAWNNLGQYQKAIGYYDKALAINREALPQGHPEILKTEANLAEAEKQQTR